MLKTSLLKKKNTFFDKDIKIQFFFFFLKIKKEQWELVKIGHIFLSIQRCRKAQRYSQKKTVR